MQYNLELIAQWFKDTGIIEHSSIDKQFIKFVEEIGEVSEELTSSIIDKESLGGEIGDLIVVLTGMAMLEGLDLKHLDITGFGKCKFDALARLNKSTGDLAGAIAKGGDKNFILIDLAACIDGLCLALSIDKNECAHRAYKKISKRKGKMINGVFVKESDL